MGMRWRMPAAWLLAGALGGCGHAAFQPAVPANLAIALTPAAGEAGTASVTLNNAGLAWQLHVTGRGLRATGQYTIFLINLPSGLRQGVGQAPFVLNVQPDGRVNDLLAARMRAATSLGVVVDYAPSPSGAPQQAFSGTFPAPIR